MSDTEHDPAVTKDRDNKYVTQEDDPDVTKVRERRSFSRETPTQVNNYRLGLLQEKEYAKLAKDSDRESAVDAELGKLDDHVLSDDTDPDIVSVGPSSYDINSSYTVRPSQPDVDDGTIRGDGNMPRGVAQPPDIVNIPNPARHTEAVTRRNAEEAEKGSNRPATVGGVPVDDKSDAKGPRAK